MAVYLGTAVVREIWGRLYGVAAPGAMAQLENILPYDQREEINWARRSLITSGLHRSRPTSLFPILEELRCAAREYRQVSAVYGSASRARPTRREIDPYALVFRAGPWYLIGYCHLRAALCSFRVDRIQKMTMLDKSLEIPVTSTSSGIQTTNSTACGESTPALRGRGGAGRDQQSRDLRIQGRKS